MSQDRVEMQSELPNSVTKMQDEILELRSDRRQFQKEKEESQRIQEACFVKIRRMEEDLKASAERVQFLENSLAEKTRKFDEKLTVLDEERAEHLKTLNELQQQQQKNLVLTAENAKLENRAKEAEKSKAFLKAHAEFQTIVNETEKKTLTDEIVGLNKEMRKSRLRIYEQNYLLEKVHAEAEALKSQFLEKNTHLETLLTEARQKDARIELLTRDRNSYECHVNQLMKNYGRVQNEMRTALRLIRKQKASLEEFEEQTMTSSSTHLRDAVNNEEDDFFDHRLLYPTWASGEAEYLKTVYERFGLSPEKKPPSS